MSGQIHLKDRYGNDLGFLNGGDVWVPIYPDIDDDYRQHLKNLRRLEMRPDDVIVAGYPRSGNNWHNQIVHMLMQGTTEYTGFLGDDFVDGLPAEKVPPVDKPRLMGSHLRFHHLPMQVKEKGVKVIYLYRSPKDVWVSLYNIHQDMKMPGSFKGTWPHFYELMMTMGYWYGDWFDHVLDWEAEAATNLNTFFSSFELLKQDPVGQITKMDQFLGLDRGPALCQQIAEACRFSKLKAAKDAQFPKGKKHLFKEGGDGLFRKGQTGDWKNWFTVAQSEKFDELFDKRMSGSKLRFTFE